MFRWFSSAHILYLYSIIWLLVKSLLCSWSPIQLGMHFLFDSASDFDSRSLGPRNRSGPLYLSKTWPSRSLLGLVPSAVFRLIACVYMLEFWKMPTTLIQLNNNDDFVYVLHIGLRFELEFFFFLKIGELLLRHIKRKAFYFSLHLSNFEPNA